MSWTIESARRVIIDLTYRLLKQPFTGTPQIYHTGQNLRDDFLLDSIQVLDLAAQVNAFFHLMETGPDNYLLSSSDVDEWAQKCVNGRRTKNEKITFLTSGTSGTEKIITHQQAYIDREVQFLSEYFRSSTCIIPLIPSYSIYGYLFTVALPDALNAPVLFPGEVNWKKLEETALIIGTPFTWSHLLKGMPDQPISAKGVCSTASLSTSLFRDILSRGIHLTEVYGATETAGVGFREQPESAFEPFPYWSLLDESTILDKDSGRSFQLMDRVEQRGTNNFTVHSRRDQKLKIAGRLVDLEDVAHRINTLDGVRNCQLSAKKQTDRTNITAFVTLESDTAEARQAFLSAIKSSLDRAEQPTEVHFTEP